MVKVTDELINHLEELSRIGLGKNERERLKESLQEILDYMKMLDEVDVKEIEPMYTPVEIEAPKREDEVREFPAEGIKKNFPGQERGHVKVPPIIG